MRTLPSGGQQFLVWLILILLAIIATASVVQAAIQSVASLYILSEIKEVNKVVQMINEGNHVMDVVTRVTRSFEDGTRHLNITDVIRKSVPDTDDEMSARIVEFGHGVKSAGSVATEFKEVNVLGMIKPLLQVAVKLAGKKETAVFGEASSVLAKYVAENAKKGNVDFAFGMLKDVVNIVIDVAKNDGTKEALSKAQSRINEALSSERLTKLAEDVAAIVAQAKDANAVDSVSKGATEIGDLTEFLRGVNEDFRRGGITISLPGFYRDNREEEMKSNLIK